jgi:ATP-dependent RNA helicase DeaD
VNYDVPSAPDAYVHRIGRVGRAGREGVAITLAEPREHRMIKNIERVTGRRIEIQKVPTVADLRTRRLEMMRASLREAILGGDLDGFRVVVETLADEFDVMEVALAAVKLADDAVGGPSDEVEIPDVALREDRPARRASASPQRPKPRGGGPAGETIRLFVGAGRTAGVRPQDLVGAVAGESRLTGRDVGAIEIFDRFSLVEVPAAAAEEVIAGLRASTIKGRKVRIKREGEDPKGR